MNNITIDMRMTKLSGIGTYLNNIVPIVVKELKDFHFYLLGNESELASKFIQSNVTIINYDAQIYSLEEIFKRDKTIDNTDLLWIPHINIPILYKGKMIITIHDVFHLAHFEQLTLPQKVYTKGISHFLKRKPKMFLTVSEFSKQEIIKYLVVKEEKIIVTHNGVDDTWKNVETLKLINDDSPYLIYIGNVKPHKNLRNLIIAFNSIKEKIPHDLIIVGKKDGFITGDENLIKLANSMDGRVKFTGFVEDEELRQYLKQADAMVFPSYYEGFGLPPLEAMACSTPVIASNSTSIPEVCGDAALYFDPYRPDDIAEKIYTFISDEQLQRDLREKGLKRSELFSWEKCAQETIKVIEEVLTE